MCELCYDGFIKGLWKSSTCTRIPAFSVLHEIKNLWKKSLINLNFFSLAFLSVIISFCWLLGGIVGFLPLFGWHDRYEENQGCYFVEIMDYNYLVFLYFATIITPALLLFAFYAHIYTVIIKQVIEFNYKLYLNK